MVVWSMEGGWSYGARGVGGRMEHGGCAPQAHRKVGPKGAEKAPKAARARRSQAYDANVARKGGESAGQALVGECSPLPHIKF